MIPNRRMPKDSAISREISEYNERHKKYVVKKPHYPQNDSCLTCMPSMTKASAIKTGTVYISYILLYYRELTRRVNDWGRTGGIDVFTAVTKHMAGRVTVAVLHWLTETG